MIKSIQKKRIDEYLKTLDRYELVNYIKVLANGVKRSSDQMKKAVQRELDTPTNASRAKRTTVYANTWKITKVYNSQVDDLKYVVSKL